METNELQTTDPNSGGTVNLTVGNIINNGFQIGLKSFVPLIGAAFLWVITIWIPYLNVGTTIGLLSIVIALGKDKPVSPTEIFNPKYRKYMGEFFILVGFLYLGVMIGYVFFIIPGLVIAISWSLALYLFLEYEMAPMDSLMLSNKLTYGHKWTIFWGLFVLEIIMYVGFFIVYYIFSFIHDFVGMLFGALVLIAIMPIMLGAVAYIYRTLKVRVPEFKK
jgi:hypothetical protein